MISDEKAGPIHYTYIIILYYLTSEYVFVETKEHSASEAYFSKHELVFSNMN